MDERLIGWIILLVGYFIYNAVKKANENKRKKGAPRPPASPPQDSPNTPEKTLEDLFGEVFGEQKPTPPPPPPQPTKPRYESVEYSSPPVDSVPKEEGTSAFKRKPAFNETIEAEKITMKSRHGKMPFSPREAFKYKVLLDRKYID